MLGPLGSVLDLPAPWCDEPYLLVNHGRSSVLGAWLGDGALLGLLEGTGRPPGFVGLGPPDAVAALCSQAITEAPDAVADAHYLTLARGALELVPPATAACLEGFGRRSDWDWMWTEQPLAGDRGSARRLPASSATDGQVAALLEHAHPAGETRPDDPRLIGWWGVRDPDGDEDGRLVGVVGALRFAPGLAPYLVSLAVAPSHRGRGLAGRLLAAAVQDGLVLPQAVGPRRVTLALYADNHTARRVYLRHGFRPGRVFTSHRRPTPVSA